MFKKFYEWTDKIREKLNEKGQGMVEYALILAAVAIIAVVAIWGTSTADGVTASSEGSLKGAVVGAFDSAAKHIKEGTK